MSRGLPGDKAKLACTSHGELSCNILEYFMLTAVAFVPRGFVHET